MHNPPHPGETLKDEVLTPLNLATKLKVIFQRIEANDYKDVAEILKSGVPLDKGIALAQKLYGNAFSPQECLRTLTYFEGGNLDSLSKEDRQTLIEQVAQVDQLADVQSASKTLSPGREAVEAAPALDCSFELSQVQREYLLRLAPGYIWWKTSEEALRYPNRLIAQIMDIGTFADVRGLVRVLRKDRLAAVVGQAEVGWFRPKSWSYWHYRLGLTPTCENPPPMPQRF